MFESTETVSGTGVLGGMLADNGGAVHTVSLSATPANPALDAGDSTLANQLITPTGVVSSTVDTDTFPSVNAINNGTITLQNFESIVEPGSASETWSTEARNGGTGNDYFANAGDPDPSLVFDLGSIHLLSDVAIWGNAIAAANDIKVFT